MTKKTTSTTEDIAKIQTDAINSASIIFKHGVSNMIDTTIKAIKDGLDPIESLERLKVAVNNIKEI